MARKAATPPEVAGPKVADLYAQHKARAEVDALLSSEKPGAGAKAFAGGFAAATTGAFAISAIPELFRRAERKDAAARLLDEDRLAHYIQRTRGESLDSARVNASALMRLLDMGSGGQEGTVQSLLNEAGGVVHPSGMEVDLPTFSSEFSADMGKAIEQHGKNPSEFPEYRRFAMFNSMENTVPKHTFRSAGVSPGGKQAVLDFLRKTEKGGMTEGQAARKVLRGRLAPLVAAALPFGVAGGYEAYRGVRDRRQTLQRLKEAK